MPPAGPPPSRARRARPAAGARPGGPAMPPPELASGLAGPAAGGVAASRVRTGDVGPVASAGGIRRPRRRCGRRPPARATPPRTRGRRRRRRAARRRRDRPQRSSMWSSAAPRRGRGGGDGGGDAGAGVAGCDTARLWCGTRAASGRTPASSPPTQCRCAPAGSAATTAGPTAGGAASCAARCRRQLHCGCVDRVPGRRAHHPVAVLVHLLLLLLLHALGGVRDLAVSPAPCAPAPALRFSRAYAR